MKHARSGQHNIKPPGVRSAQPVCRQDRPIRVNGVLQGRGEGAGDGVPADLRLKGGDVLLREVIKDVIRMHRQF